MGKKKKRKVPAQKTQVPVLKKRSPRLGLPRCPECGRTTKYSQCAAKLPFFSISCRCGTRFRCRPGMMSCALWVLTLLLCFGMIRLVISVSTDMIPVFFFTAVFVIGAFFLSLFTMRAGNKSRKNAESENRRVQPPKKNEK